MQSVPVIEVESLCLTLKGPSGNMPILKEVALRVNAGEKVGLMGPSGSGKTSLMLILAGLERATGGSVRMCGQQTEGMTEDALAAFRRANIGIVFQNFHLIAGMNALENVAVPLELSGDHQAFAKAREALVAVGLSHRTDHFPSQLSGGEQQRVALARAFAVRPRLLLADEPTGNLDRENGEQIMQLMFDMQRLHGSTLLLITHDKSLAERCDRTIMMRDGRVA